MMTRPPNPSERRVSAAFAPARLAPMITKVGSVGIGLSSLGRCSRLPAQTAVPGDGGSIRERGHLVDDDAQALRVGPGCVVAGAQCRVQRLRGARQHGGGQFGDQLPLPGLYLRRAIAAHHVVRGDAFEQRALEPLPAWHHQIGVVPGEAPGLAVLTTMAVLAAVTALTTMAILTALPGIRAGRERRFLCRPAEAPDQLAGQVLQPGEIGRPAVEPFRPAGQPEQVIEYLAQLR